MDYTPNFHLPQWNLDDRILMDDFNQFAASLDTALSLNQQAAQNAQEAAEEAKTGLQMCAKTTFGMYRGNGGTFTMELGGLARVTFISGRPTSTSPSLTNDVSHKYTGFLVVGGVTACGRIDSTSFTVFATNREDCPSLNTEGYHYAFAVIC